MIQNFVLVQRIPILVILLDQNILRIAGSWGESINIPSLVSLNLVTFILKRRPAIRQGYLLVSLHIYLNMFYTGENYDQPSDGYATLFMTNTIYLYTLFNQSFTALIYNYKSLFI